MSKLNGTSIIAGNLNFSCVALEFHSETILRNLEGSRNSTHANYQKLNRTINNLSLVLVPNWIERR